MNVLRIREIGDATRLGALCGSAIAVLMFGISFATDKQLAYHIGRFLIGQAENLGLAIFLGLVLAVFVGYLVAARRNFAIPGSMLAICSVGAIYAWCQVGLNFFPGPYLAVMVSPALLHILAAQLHRLSLQSEIVSLQNEAVSVLNTA